VGANYGLIKETQTFVSPESSFFQGWTAPVALAELDLVSGQTVEIKMDLGNVQFTSIRTLYIYAKDNFGNTVTTQEFELSTMEGVPAWEPDLENLFHLFTVQNLGKYTIYADSQVRFDGTFYIVVTNPPPYAMVLLLGLIVLALGIIVLVLGVVFGRGKILSTPTSTTSQKNKAE